MNKFFDTIGRVGHIALQLALSGVQVYALYKNGDQVGAVNLGIAVVQAVIADQALKAKSPTPPPPQLPPPTI